LMPPLYADHIHDRSLVVWLEQTWVKTLNLLHALRPEHGIQPL
jgi:hypothetical protein